jgi:hypothetical protein
MKVWCIINVEDLDSSPFGWYVGKLPERQRPTLVYDFREDAERELARLSARHSGVFLLFESVAVGDSVELYGGHVGRVNLLQSASIGAICGS